MGKQHAPAKNQQVSKVQDQPIRKLMEVSHARITNSLEGSGISPETFTTHLIASMTDEKLNGCTNVSRCEAIVQCAALWLFPHLGHVALIPRNIQGRGRVVTLMVQWQGYHAMMMRIQEVKDIVAKLVHVNDEFEYYGEGEDPEFEHRTDPLAADRAINSLEDIQGGYLRIEFKDGTVKHHFVRQDEIVRRKNCAQTTKIWDQWPKEMALKTLYRNAWQRRVLKVDQILASQMSRAAGLDDEAEGNEPIDYQRSEKPKRIGNRTTMLTESMIQQNAPPLDDPTVLDSTVSGESEQAPEHGGGFGLAEEDPQLKADLERKLRDAQDVDALKAVGTEIKEYGFSEDSEIVTHLAGVYRECHTALTKAPSPSAESDPNQPQEPPEPTGSKAYQAIARKANDCVTVSELKELAGSSEFLNLSNEEKKDFTALYRELIAQFEANGAGDGESGSSLF